MSNGRVSEVHLNKQEYDAFEIISYGKEMNQSQKQIEQNLDQAKITTHNRRIGSKAYIYAKQGAFIVKGGHIPAHIGDPFHGQYSMGSSNWMSDNSLDSR